jgi:hypothetical protein
MGAPNIEEYLPGEKSIIRTDSFSGPKVSLSLSLSRALSLSACCSSFLFVLAHSCSYQELAEYLLWLVDHPVAYRSYFEWKKKGLSQRFREKYSRCVFYSGECRLCMKVAEKMTLPQKRIEAKISWTADFDGQGSKIVIDSRKKERKGRKDKKEEVEHTEVFSENPFQFTDEFSLTAWVFPKRLENDRIIDKNHAGGITGFLFDLIEVGKRTYLRLCASEECFVGKKPIWQDTWYFVAVVFDKRKTSEVSFFVDGELESTIRIRPFTTMSLNDLPLTIGELLLISLSLFLFVEL